MTILRWVMRLTTPSAPVPSGSFTTPFLWMSSKLVETTLKSGFGRAATSVSPTLMMTAGVVRSAERSATPHSRISISVTSGVAVISGEAFFEGFASTKARVNRLTLGFMEVGALGVSGVGVIWADVRGSSRLMDERI
jgi:hypothetical protein